MTPTPTVEATATPPPTETPVAPTETQINLPITPSETLPPTATEIPGRIKKCLEVLPEVPLREVAAEGWVVYSKETLGTEVYINHETGEQYQISPQLSTTSRFVSAVLSPNRKYVAIEEHQMNQEMHVINSHLWIVNAKGEIVANIDYDLTWGNFRWVNDTQLQINYLGEGQRWPFNTLIIDPWTKKRVDIPAPFPNYYDQDWDFQGPWWTMVYSPDMDQVVYVSNGEEEGPWGGVVLWDRPNEAALWQKSDPASMYSSTPAWSPQGDQVAVVVENNLYLISQDGKENQATFFGENTSVRSFSWSPDGHWIAFWVSYKQEAVSRFFILDTITNTITDYCFEIYPSGRIPFWSSDSRKVVIRIMVKPDGDSRNISLFSSILKTIRLIKFPMLNFLFIGWY